MFPVNILEKDDTVSIRPEPRYEDDRNGFSGKLQSMNRNRQREAMGNTSRKVARQELPKPAGAYIMPPNTADSTWSHRMLCLPCWVLVLLCSQSYFFVSNFIPWNGDAFSAQVVLAKSLPCISEKTLNLDF